MAASSSSNRSETVPSESTSGSARWRRRVPPELDDTGSDGAGTIA